MRIIQSACVREREKGVGGGGGGGGEAEVAHCLVRLSTAEAGFCSRVLKCETSL